MTDPAAPKIAFHGLAKSFGAKQVLRGVDLEVGHAESVVVIGGSGSGKSVLLKCLLGLMPADAGTIQVDGETASDMSAAAGARLMTKLGMLFQG